MIDTDEKNKNNKVWIIAIVLLIVAVAIFIYSRQPQKTQVPKEFILSTDAQKRYDEQQNLEVARFTSDKSKQELIDFYLGKLQKEGWTVKTNTAISEKSYVIYATQPENRINVFILSTSDPNKFEVEVTYLRGLK